MTERSPAAASRLLSNIRGRRVFTALAAIAALVIAVLANRRLNAHTLDLATVALLLAGLAATLFASKAILPPLRSTPPAPITNRRPVLHAIALIVTLGAAGIAWQQASDNRFRLLGVIAWAVALAAWLLAWWPGAFDAFASVPKRRPAVPSSVSIPRARLIVIGSLAIIMAVGIFVRFHRIGVTPAEPTSDHAEKLLDITDLVNGEHRVFFPRNTGREPAQFYFTGFVLIRGLDLPVEHRTLKIGTAIVDTLAILVVFALASELFGRTTGLAAAGLYSFAAWAAINGTFGLRPSWGPFTAGLALWAFFRFCRTKRRDHALLAGGVTGAGLYGYTAFRTVPIAIVAIAILLLALDRSLTGRRRRFITDCLLLGSTAAIAFIPLARYMADNPHQFWYRTTTRVSGSERGIDGNRLEIFLRNNWNAAQMFNWRSDIALVNFAPFHPALDVVMGGAFLLGLALAVFLIVQQRDLRAAGALLAIPILMLSSTLAIAFPAESPSFSRSFLVAPLIFTLLALPFAGVVRASRAAFGSQRGALLALAALAPLVVISAGASNRFVREYDLAYRNGVPNASQIAAAIDGAAVIGVTHADAYILSAPFWLDHRNVAFAMHDIAWADSHNIGETSPLPAPAPGRPLFLIVKADDAARIIQIRAIHPNAIITLIESGRVDKNFFTVFIPAG